MIKTDKILITGASGIVGKNLVKMLRDKGFDNLLTPSHDECDFESYINTFNYFGMFEPDYVINLAALVGGIEYNMSHQSDMLFKNIMINMNVITIADMFNVKKLMTVGSSCMYPQWSTKTKETDLLAGKPESTNEGYALAKIAAVKYCDYLREKKSRDFISIIPCNIYGDLDKSSLEKNHAVSAIMKKVHIAKITGAPMVTIFGTGKPVREFVHVKDVCSAILFLIENYSQSGAVNVGTNESVSIYKLTEIICESVGYIGVIKNDLSKPDGSMIKIMDNTKLRELGWSYSVSLKDGLKSMYENYLEDFE